MPQYALKSPFLFTLRRSSLASHNGAASGTLGELIGVVPELIIAMHVAASPKASTGQLGVVDLANNHGARQLSSRVPSYQDRSRMKEVATCRQSTYARMHKRTPAHPPRESCMRIHRPSSAHASLHASCGRSGLFTPRMRHFSRGASQRRGGLANVGLAAWGDLLGCRSRR